MPRLTLQVGNLPIDIRERELEDLFGKVRGSARSWLLCGPVQPSASALLTQRKGQGPTRAARRPGGAVSPDVYGSAPAPCTTL
jgi:hypothetical protein